MVLAIQSVSGLGIPLLLDDIDTDRIIPARYLRCVTFDGLGAHAFEDDRKQDQSHPFNSSYPAGDKILVAGRNFGCGSSREHAPQALMRWGIKGIVAESFAEIFFGNCTALGIPCVCASRSDLTSLVNLMKSHPELSLTIDLGRLVVQASGQEFTVTMLESAKTALMTGNWDFLGQLLDGATQVQQTATRIPYLNFAS